jgi:hypothetical protein
MVWYLVKQDNFAFTFTFTFMSIQDLNKKFVITRLSLVNVFELKNGRSSFQRSTEKRKVLKFQDRRCWCFWIYRLVLHPAVNYEVPLKSSWTHLITPSRNLVEVRWRSLFRSTSFGNRCTSYNAPPTSRKRAADRCSLRNFLPRSSLFMGRDLGCMEEVLMGFHLSTFSKPNTIQFRSRPMWFLGFSNHEKGAPKQEFLKWSTVCSTFSRSGPRVVWSTSLAKEDTSKKRPSPQIHEVRLRVKSESTNFSKGLLI